MADDHPLFRSAISRTLGEHPDLKVVAEAANGRHALEFCRRFKPDLVLMDLRMPEMDGVAATRAVRAEFPETPVLILTALDGSTDLSDALEAGAAGYVLKHASVARITDAVRRVLAGEAALDEELAMRLFANLVGVGGREQQGREQEHGPAGLAASETPLEGGDGARPHGSLTSREVEVLRLMVRGRTNQQIARALAISVSTVKRHVRHIGAKLGARDRVQAAVRATELGLLTEPKGD